MQLDRSIPLQKVENSKLYKDTETLLQKALQHQWQDLLLSGIVNSFFLRYKDFFVNRRGMQIKIRKAEDADLEYEDDPANENITSLMQLREEENRAQGRDKLLVPGKVLNMAALLLFLDSLVEKNINTISTYYKLKPELKNYLKTIGNKGGKV